MKIERINQDDSRVFEVALKKGDELLWGQPRRLSLDVVGEWGSEYTLPLSSPIQCLTARIFVSRLQDVETLSPYSEESPKHE